MFLCHFQDRNHAQSPRVPRPIPATSFALNRPAPGSPRQSSNNELYPSHQQLPFRNGRNRFQPNTENNLPASSSEKTLPYNRFGSRPQAQPPRTSVNPIVQAKPNKALYQPRKPSPGGRDANSPIRVHNTPFPGKLISGDDFSGNKAQEISEDDVDNTNQLKSQLIPPSSASALVAQNPPEQNKSKADGEKEDNMTILTSNFFLPGNANQAVDKPSSTTENPEYDYDEYDEYDDDYEEDSTTDPPGIRIETPESTSAANIQSSTTESKIVDATTPFGPTSEDTTIVHDAISEQSTDQNKEVPESEQSKDSSEKPTLEVMTDYQTEQMPQQTGSTEELSRIQELEKLTIEDVTQTEKDESRTEFEYDYNTENAQVPVEDDPTEEADILGKAIVSVVTTKSVINGSTAFPAPVTHSTLSRETLSSSVNINFELPSSTEHIQVETPDSVIEKNQPELPVESSSPETEEANNATESWVVVASIQTSRSISGARFLPFPAIEQEEKKQPLSELERKVHEQKNARPVKKPEEMQDQPKEPVETTTVQTVSTEETSERSSIGSVSTESIIDKLDRVQSELSSGLLTGKFPILNDMSDLMRPSTQSTTTTGHPPVVIKKFSPKTSTTKRPDGNKSTPLDDLPMDDLTGFLPPGFKARPPSSYRNKKTTTTTTTRLPAVKPQRNATTSRSFKNSPVAAQEIILAGVLPKGYKSNDSVTTESTKNPSNALEDLFSKIKFEDNISALLPKGYKPPEGSTTTKRPTSTTKKQMLTTLDDISKFLPPGYKMRTTTTKKPPSSSIQVKDDVSHLLPPGYKAPKEKTEAPAIKIKDDISHLLPPGFKPSEEKPEKPSIPVKDDISHLLPPGYKPSGENTKAPAIVVSDDISKFLPPGFKLDANKKDDTANVDILKLLPKDYKPKPGEEAPKPTPSTKPANEAPTSTSKPEGAFKVVFPKSLNKRPGVRLTTPKTHNAEGPPPPPINIKKGPPTR